MLSRNTKLALVALAAAGAGLYGFLEIRGRSTPEAVPADAYPPGRWHRVATAPEETGQDLDRVLSLPYLQGKVEAGAAFGVVRHEPASVHPGVNLYVSGHAPEAILMDMEGRTLHRWRLPFGEAFPDRTPDQGGLYFRRATLLPEGDLLVLFQGWGLVRLDVDGQIRWVWPEPAFNDFHTTEDGRILVLHKQARSQPEAGQTEPMLEDFVVELSSDGVEQERWSLLELFNRSVYAGLLDSMAPHGDVLHSNTVTLLEQSPFSEGVFQPHHLLVSLREVDVIGVLDPAAREVVWAARGAWRRQHEPVLLSSGAVLLFDNQGAPGGGARVIEVQPDTGEIVWSWGEDAGQRMFSPEGGSVARLPNGNTLITASESGRVIEVTPDGAVVWEFLSPHRAGPNDSLVASLWELVRLEPESIDWLDASQR